MLKSDFEAPINEIRCRNGISIADKEDLVTTYLSFITWLSAMSFGRVPSIIDPDLFKIMGRVIGHRQFIQFLSKLDQKGQLVAKLLYFGGSRTLDDILSLKLEDVNFKSSLIRYDSQLVSYPEHYLTI